MELFNHRDPQGQHYRVCRAGQSIRLYTDGVFHTQYHPQRQYDGSVWDLLWLPSTALSNQAVRRILVLGVGGGAVICALRKRYPGALIIGVDINPVHLTIARRFFNAAGPNTLLLEADALAFMRDYRGPGFDVVVDDLFAAQNGQPIRVVDVTPAWAKHLCRALTPRGLLLVNLAADRELRRARQVLRRSTTVFKAALAWSHRRYDNRIGAFYRQLPAPDWRDGLAALLPAQGRRDVTVRRL
jgi:spermidine synthase